MVKCKNILTCSGLQVLGHMSWVTCPGSHVLGHMSHVTNTWAAIGIPGNQLGGRIPHLPHLGSHRNTSLSLHFLCFYVSSHPLRAMANRRLGLPAMGNPGHMSWVICPGTCPGLHVLPILFSEGKNSICYACKVLCCGPFSPRFSAYVVVHSA